MSKPWENICFKDGKPVKSSLKAKWKCLKEQSEQRSAVPGAMLPKKATSSLNKHWTWLTQT